jgi:hypothetical protein
MGLATGRRRLIVVWGVLLLSIGCSPSGETAPDAPTVSSEQQIPLQEFASRHNQFGPVSPRPEGLTINDPRAWRGYTLLAPTMSPDTFLIDADARVVHTWHCGFAPAMSAKLLDNGNLLRPCVLPPDEIPFPHSGGGGRVREYSWDGELVWDFRYGDAHRLPHHDVLKLPGGNVLMVVCDRVPAADALAAGRRPNSFTGEYLFSDGVVEVKSTGPTTGEVVWEWHVWDHLVQEQDRTKPNYSAVADHPELIDLNYCANSGALVGPGPDLAKLQALGYVGAAAGAPANSPAGALSGADWTHLNCVAYNAELDQIAVTGLGFSEVWIIDHSTSRTASAGHSGGKGGKGGDLLYRWGNPRAYRHGTTADQRLTGPHCASWIGPGVPGAGHLLVFNNRTSPVSSVEEIAPPVDESGRYARVATSAFAPDKPVWSYSGQNKPDFFSMSFSSAQRLPNGNTLVCLGLPGTILEITPDAKVVWKYGLSGSTMPRFSTQFPGRQGPLSVGRDGMRPSGATLFGASRYGPDYPGLAGKDLTPKTDP